MLVADLVAVPKRLWQFQRALSSFNNRATLPVRQAPFSQQFSLWPCHPPPGEGTRPTSPTKPPSCRPGALTRRPLLVHNENCSGFDRVAKTLRGSRGSGSALGARAALKSARAIPNPRSELIATPAEQQPIELGHSRNSDFGLLSGFGLRSSDFRACRTGSSLNWPDFRAALSGGTPAPLRWRSHVDHVTICG